MVQSRPHLFALFGRPKPVRITGLSVAIVIHATAALLLTLPGEVIIAPVIPAAVPFETVPIVAVQPRETFEVPAMPVAPERTRPEPVAVITAPVTPAVTTPSAFSVPFVPSRSLDTGVGEPLTVSIAPAPAQVALKFAPPPTFPRAALRAGLEGTVVLRVRVGVDGSPREVHVEQSSGHRVLDRAALDQVVQRWRFAPAMRSGQAIEAWALIPVDFIIPR